MRMIPFARPMLGQEEEEAVLRVMRSGWLTTGSETEAFEREFAGYLGVPDAVAVNSATAGLHLALEALGVRENDRVAMSPYTFTATAETVRYLGAHPYFIDIEPDGFNIDFGRFENAVRRIDLKAVIPVHIAGRPCRMTEILECARTGNIRVIEDAAHAFPVRTGIGFLGTLGDAGVFSFYATKTITTGEGGMVLTPDPEVTRRIRLMRLHGIDRDVWDRYRSSTAAWEYAVTEAGFKYNMPDLSAAIGRVQLRKADGLLARRRQIAERYKSGLKNREYLVLPEIDGPHSLHLYIIQVRPERLTITRDEYIHLLFARGVGVSVHYRPLHMMPYYSRLYGFTPGDFPVSLKRYLCSISLPIYPSLTDEEQDQVIRSVCEIGDQAYRSRSL